MSRIETVNVQGFAVVPGCFICGGNTSFYGNTRAYKVPNQQSGQDICHMFNHIGARLDCWDTKGEWIHVIVGACHQHGAYLEILDEIIRQEKTITPEIINQAKNFTIDKVEIIQKSGIKTTPWNIKDLSNDSYLPTQSNCFVCNSSIIFAFGLRVQSEKSIFELFKPNNIMSKNGGGSQADLYILSCAKHKHDLEHLSHVISAYGNIINPEIIAKVIHDSKFNQIQRRINCPDCNTFSN